MTAEKNKPDEDVRVIATNRKARHLYHILETWEAGLVLRGTEVKSLRQGQASLVDSFAEPVTGEIWLHNLHIPPYDKGNRANVDSKRTRKLLLSRREIHRLTGAATEKGHTIVPLRLYFRGQYVKMQIALVRGKKEYDKREGIKERDAQRDMDRAMSRRRRG